MYCKGLTVTELLCIRSIFTWNLYDQMHGLDWILWSYCWAQLLSCPCPIQGHRYCPLAKSVRPSLTQIRFLSKWDFYCSKGAASRISFPQPFPVSSKRGSSATLQFFFCEWFSPSRIFSGTNLEHRLHNFACVGPSLDFKEWKEFLKKRYPPTLVSLTQAYKHTHKQGHTDFASYILMRPLWAISLDGVRSPATPKWNVPMVPQHVASLLSQRKYFFVCRSDHTLTLHRHSNEHLKTYSSAASV